jgi:HD superfamily phosphohydrolase
MPPYDSLPEIAGLDAAFGLIRIPPEQDVPLTPRVRRLIDTAAFRRLARISQLGLVSLVYPSAHHTRFEHSLGVYRNALLYLRRLGHDARFARLVDARGAELFIAAALLHDLGHWPFCHAIEDMRLPAAPRHEELAASFLQDGALAELLERDWHASPADVIALLEGRHEAPREKLLASLLSGPIDVDKMDYLARDSLHAGVPYGRNFDAARLIGSLCVNEAGDGLAISDKGRTAAEMMVFARYVMFSEVYWHHAVRSATAMLQRSLYLLWERLDRPSLFALDEPAWIAAFQQAGAGEPAGDLLAGLFGPRRSLYKRLAQFSYYEEPAIYKQLARRPYAWLAKLAEAFAAAASRRLARPLADHEVLFDAPPVGLEVQFQVPVYLSKENRYLPLGEVSPVVRSLALQQFDDYVKRVRIFIHPARIDELRAVGATNELVSEALSDTRG